MVDQNKWNICVVEFVVNNRIAFHVIFPEFGA